MKMSCFHLLFISILFGVNALAASKGKLLLDVSDLARPEPQPVKGLSLRVMGTPYVETTDRLWQVFDSRAPQRTNPNPNCG